MEVLDAHVRLRRSMNSFYMDLFKNAEGISVFKEPSTEFYSNHWLSCIILDPKNTTHTPSEIIEALAEDNIESRPLWKPMHLQPVFKNAPYYGTNVAEAIFNNGLCLPSGSNLSEVEKNRIFKALGPFL